MNMPFDAAVHDARLVPDADADADSDFFQRVQEAVISFPGFKARGIRLDTKPASHPEPSTLIEILKRGIARAAQFTEAPSLGDWKAEDTLRDGIRGLTTHVFEAFQAPAAEPSEMPTIVAVVVDPMSYFMVYELVRHPEHAVVIAEAMTELDTPEKRYAALTRIVEARNAYMTQRGMTECPPIEIFMDLVRRAVHAPTTTAAARNVTFH